MKMLNDRKLMGKLLIAETVHLDESREGIIGICYKHIRVCRKLIREARGPCLQEAEAILQLLCRVLGSTLSSEQSLMEKALRLRVVVLKTQLIMVKIKASREDGKNMANQYSFRGEITPPSPKEIDFLARLPLLCKQFEKDLAHTKHLQRDYYSQIQLLYLHAAMSFILCRGRRTATARPSNGKASVIVSNKARISELIEQGRSCLDKQLEKLCLLLAETEDKKIFDIITKKCQCLLQFFVLELAITLTADAQKNDETLSELQIKEDCLCEQSTMKEALKGCCRLRVLKKQVRDKYEKIINLVPGCLDLKQVESTVTRTFLSTEASTKKGNDLEFRVKRVPRGGRSCKQKSFCQSKDGRNQSVIAANQVDGDRKNGAQEIIEDKKVVVRISRSMSSLKLKSQDSQYRKRQIMRIFKTAKFSFARTSSLRLNQASGKANQLVRLSRVLDEPRKTKRGQSLLLVIPGLMKQESRALGGKSTGNDQ